MQPTHSTDPWAALRAHTPARIALGACGNSMPTAQMLQLGIAHARARDAVHQPLDAAALGVLLQGLELPVLQVHSAAPDRQSYLLRPDWGRVLSDESQRQLNDRPRVDCDVLCVVGDGLSATAVQRYAAPLLQALVPQMRARGWRMGPLVLAQQARVALADPVAIALGARMVLMLIGERPGLSASDSMGAYLTWAPRPGTPDALRNCVSNIREAGLRPPVAAARLVWLMEHAMALQATGIALKDESGCSGVVLAAPAAAPPPALG